MNKLNLCPPAIIYLIFSATQILIDLYKKMYNTAGMKLIVTVMVTILLNMLCINGLGTVSWIIVFIPFMLMTVIVSMLLYIFGLDVSNGTLNTVCGSSVSSNGDVADEVSQKIESVKISDNGDIVIYAPNYSPTNYPVYYKNRYIIIPRQNIANTVQQPLQ